MTIPLFVFTFSAHWFYGPHLYFSLSFFSCFTLTAIISLISCNYVTNYVHCPLSIIQKLAGEKIFPETTLQINAYVVPWVSCKYQTGITPNSVIIITPVCSLLQHSASPSCENNILSFHDQMVSKAWRAWLKATTCLTIGYMDLMRGNLETAFEVDPHNCNVSCLVAHKAKKF